MNANTTIITVFFGLFLTLWAGFAVYSAARNCVDRIESRQNEIVAELYGN